MNRGTFSLVHLICATLTVAGLSACAYKPGQVSMKPESLSQPDIVGVRKAHDQFYSALNVLFTGNSGPMESLWSHSDSIAYMGPAGGTLIGWSQVQQEWTSQASKKWGGKVVPENIHMTIEGDLAIVINTEIGENIGPNGQPLKVSIRATSVFRKEDGVWKMIGRHTDLLPFLSKAS